MPEKIRKPDDEEPLGEKGTIPKRLRKLLNGRWGGADDAVLIYFKDNKWLLWQGDDPIADKLSIES